MLCRHVQGALTKRTTIACLQAMSLPTRVGGSFSAVWPGIRALHQELRVRLKVPPHVVRVKYKTTRSSGSEVDTPGTRRFMRPTSVFLGFSCGKLRIWASVAGFCNPPFTQLSQSSAVRSREQGARVVQLRFLPGGNVERQEGRKAGRQEGRKAGRQEGRKAGRQEV
jgi:hypothetical protein